MQYRRPTSKYYSRGTDARPAASGGGQGPRRNARRPRQVKVLDISSYIARSHQAQAQPQVVEEHVVTRSFSDFQVHKTLYHNIVSQGFSTPTPIQDRVFDAVRDRRDVLGIANTGTGKTGAFLIPLIDRMLADPQQKLLVIAPTRELAVQIHDTFVALSRNTSLSSVMCIGGTHMANQITRLSRPHHAVIGTPGRILDLKKRGVLRTGEFRTVVLDEVDRMLDMGFVHDIRTILSTLSSDRQNLFFSATLAAPIATLIKEFSHDLITVSVKRQETTAAIKQEVVAYSHEDGKLEMLYELLRNNELSKVLIFGRTKHGVKRLMFQLRDQGFKTESIHGNKTQSQRQRALTDFKNDRVNILVATDVAARGLDITDVSHVINYELPETYDDYVHRIGRTGRGGKTGVALTFVRR